MTTNVTIQNRGPGVVTVLAVPPQMGAQARINQFRVVKCGKSVTLPVWAGQQLMVVEGDHSETLAPRDPFAEVGVQHKGEALPVVTVDAADTTVEHQPEGTLRTGSEG